MGAVAARGPRRRRLTAAALAAAALLSLLLLAPGARGAEIVYWDNFRDNPATVSWAGVDGSGGGVVAGGGVEIREPEGMAYDPVSNRIYVASEGQRGSGGQIAYLDLGGSSGGVLAVPGVPVHSPEGIALDPALRRLYWVNSDDDTIAWADLSGAAGGLLDTRGAPTTGAYRLALADGILYWSGATAAGERYLAATELVGGGSGRVLAVGALGLVNGLAVDPGAGRLYWLDSTSGKESLRWLPLGGGPGGSLPLGAVDHRGTGLAVDPALGKAYWGNYGLAGTRQDAIGFVSLGGATGTISPATAPVNGAQDPIVIRTPTATVAPRLTAAGTELACSRGTWAPDFPGSSVFQSPRSFSYRWSLNGTTIPGAAGPSHTATAAGVYGCVVVAANQAGAASQGAAATATVAPARLALRGPGRRLRVRPGGVASFRIEVVNQGDLGAARARLCLVVPRRARAELRPGKCRSLPPLRAGERRRLRLGLRVSPAAAAGGYRLRITLSGVVARKLPLRIAG
ncbi:MAG: hypothetical protein JST31_01875 [Actinobacteria bacterium]|nr:hypothetical protein [Actinomycetota bacterium]